MRRRLSKEKAERIRRDGLDLSDRHLQLRVLARLDLYKVEKIFENGAMYHVGKQKYRSVLRFDGTTAFVIFERVLDNNVLKSVGVTRTKSARWD